MKSKVMISDEHEQSPESYVSMTRHLKTNVNFPFIMTYKRLRPRYRIITSSPPELVLREIADKLSEGKYPLEGQIVQEHAFIRFHAHLQHYWSPELHVWVREEEDKAIVYGVLGPRPWIWTMFMFFYTAILTSAFFGGSYGVIQLMLGMDAPFLWSIPLGIFGVVMVFGAAQYGQYKGKKQMLELQNFLEEAVNG